jgi:hypothetical protein
MDGTPLYTRLAAAYVRGKLAHVLDVDRALFDPPLDTLDDAQRDALITLGDYVRCGCIASSARWDCRA